MIPFFDRGKQGIAELKKAAEDVGVVLSRQDVKALAEAAEASKKWPRQCKRWDKTSLSASRSDREVDRVP